MSCFLGVGKSGPVAATPRPTPVPQPVVPTPTVPTPTPAPAAPSVPIITRPVVTALGKDTVQQIVGIRKAMVKAMTRAQEIPHFGYDDEVRFKTSFLAYISACMKVLIYLLCLVEL